MVEKEIEELENIRKLLMLLLLKVGANLDEVSTALNVTPGRVSQMMPAREIRPARIECLTSK